MTIDEIIEYVRQTPGNTNPNVLKTLLQDVSSGGGSSDFSIANVTIENQTNGYLEISLPYIDTSQEEDFLSITRSSYIRSNTFIIPLYKGVALLELGNLLDEIDDADITTPPEFILSGDL